MGAFSGFAVGSRLILTRDARDWKADGEVEVVAMLSPQGVTDDGIRVRRVKPETGQPEGPTMEFWWECGRRYFQ